MYDVPEIPTEESMKMLSDMSASELYRILCGGMKASEMSSVDRAINIAAGLGAGKVGGDRRQERMDFSAGRAALDPEWRDELDLEEYAADNGLTEDEAIAELERKAYWA